jgi:hypothetical protein
MLPAFLDNVAAERVSDAMRNLVALWREKVRLAPDHTFECREDLHFATTDAIWAMTFGSEGLATCKEQTEHLASFQAITLPANIDKELVVYPAKAPPAAFEARISRTVAAVPSIAAFCASSKVLQWRSQGRGQFITFFKKKSIKIRENLTTYETFEERWGLET